MSESLQPVSTEALKRCVIYCRVSTEDQAEKDFNSCEKQELTCKDYIERNRRDGWVWIQTITDAGYSGGNLNRPGIRKLISMAKAKEMDVLVVYRRDRLFRDTGDSSSLQQFFDLNGVIVASTNEGIHDRSPHARFARQMIDAMSEMERLTIIGRVRDAFRQMAANGIWKAGFPPLGYGYIRGSGMLHVNEEEAPIVRYIFSAIAAGTSTAELARELRDRGMYGRLSRKSANDFGKPYPTVIDVYYIQRIVRNQNYRGYLRARNPDAPESLPPSSPDMWLLFKSKHVPLVDDEMWFRANRNLDARVAKPKALRIPGRITSFLSGIVRCGMCGCAMSPGQARRKRFNNLPHRYLRCSRHSKEAERSMCETRNISADAAESAILGLLQELASGTSYATRLQDPSAGKASDRIRKLKEELEIIDAQICEHRSAANRLVEFIKKGDAQIVQGDILHSAEEANRMCATLGERRSLIEQNLFEAGAIQASQGDVVSAFKRVALSFAAADMKSRNDILRRVLFSIAIHRVDEALFTGGKHRPGRSYRFVVRVRTSSLLAYNSVDTAILTERKQFVPLVYSLTARIHSNRHRQTISILETSSVIETTRFTSVLDKPHEVERPDKMNPVQRAMRWEKMIQAGDVDYETLKRKEGVSKGLISQHRKLLGLPEKILAYFRDGRDVELEKPFSLRELQRMKEMKPDAAVSYFLERIAKPKQSFLRLEPRRDLPNEGVMNAGEHPPSP